MIQSKLFKCYATTKVLPSKSHNRWDKVVYIGFAVLLLLLMNHLGHAQSLINNGGFEAGHDVIWNNQRFGNLGSATFSTETNVADVFVGTQALKVQVDTAGFNKSAFNTTSNSFALDPNSTYFYSYATKVADTSLDLEFYITDLKGGLQVYERFKPGEDFEVREGTFTTPSADSLSNAYYIVYYFEDTTTYWVDEVTLYKEEPISSLTAIPGNESVNLLWSPAIGAEEVKMFSKEGNNPFVEVKTGELDASSSSTFFDNLVNESEYTFYIEVVGGPFAGISNEVVVQPSASWDLSLINNPSFENQLTGWQNNVFAGVGSFSADNTTAAQGASSMKVDVEATSQIGSFAINSRSPSFNLFSDLDYELSFWAKSSFNGSKIELFIRSTTNDQQFLFFKNFNLNTEWQKISIPFTTNDTTEGEFFVGFQYPNVGEYFLDEIQVRGPITNFNGIPKDQSAILRWSPAAGADEVRLFRRVGNGVFQQILNGTLDAGSSVVEVGNLQNGTEYSFFLEVIGGPFKGQSNEVTLVPSTSSGESLVLNGSFERLDDPESEGQLFESWQNNEWAGAANFEVETENVAAGDQAFKIQVTEVPPDEQVFGLNTYSNDFQLNPGTTYRFAFWGRSTIASSKVIAQVARQGQPPLIAAQLESRFSTDWTYYEKTFTTPDDISQEDIFNVVFNFGTIASTFFVDFVVVEGPVSDLQAIPGDQKIVLKWRNAAGAAKISLQQRRGGEQFREIQQGTLNEDTRYTTISNLANGVPYRYFLEVFGGPFNGKSNEARATPGPNEVLNNGFEFGILNWVNNTNAADGANASFSINDDDAIEGNQALQAQVNTLGSDVRSVSTNSSFFEIEKDETYNISFWAKADAPGKEISVFLESSDFEEALGFRTYSLTDEWDIYNIEIDADTVANAGDSSFRVFIYYRNEGTYLVDDIYVGSPNDDDFCDGGDIFTSMGDSIVNVCPGDGVADLVMFDSVDAEGSNFLYVITDSANIIQRFLDTDSYDFDTTSTGISRVWGLTFSGTLTAEIGLSVEEVSATGCFDFSNNFVTVIKDEPDGGTVSFMDGVETSDDSTVKFCLNAQDSVGISIGVMMSSISNLDYTYVVTDTSNVILAYSDTAEIVIMPDYPSNVRIWGLSFAGEITAAVGQQVDTSDVASGCFSFSANFLSVVRDSVEGGELGTSLGTNVVYTCANDTALEQVAFTTSGSSMETSNYLYVVTDTSNVIMAVDTASLIDFSGFDAGIMRVWGLAYIGDLLAQIGDDAAAANLAEGCFDLTDNFVTVIIDSVSGGTISADFVVPRDTIAGDTITVCPDDDVEDEFIFNTSATVTAENSYAFLVTNANNLVLADFTDTNEISFEGTDAGTYRVWGVSYSGNWLVNVGINAANDPLSDGCFALSENFITVNRDTTACGTIPVSTLDLLAFDGLNLYPVPTQDRLNLSFVPQTEIGSKTWVSILDLSGREVYRRVFTTNPVGNNTFDIDVRPLNKGMYIIQLVNEDLSVRKKFLKE